MTDVVVKTNQGDQLVSTDGVKTPKPAYEYQARRVTLADLDGPVGQFLAEILCEIAPHAFNPGNWKGKLATFVTSRTSSFLCCGRAIGLAYLNQDAMTGLNEAKTMFCIVADGGAEQDGYEVLKEMRRWARDLGIGLVLPQKEYCNLSPGKLTNFFKAEKREEFVITPLNKS